MGEYNAGLTSMGIKEEAVSGVAETLDQTNFNAGYMDAVSIKNSPDHAQSGKQSNGKLTNPAISYNRASAGTVPVKFELSRTDTPTVAPWYFKALELAGFRVGVIDAGVNDNLFARYDGSPQCLTATINTRTLGCGDNALLKVLRGAVIADGTLSIEGNGAPLMFEGTASGAYSAPVNQDAIISITAQDDSAITGNGTVAKIGATLYNITNISIALNLGADPVTDWSQADKSNLSHFKLGNGGQPILTYGAIPISPDGVEDYDALFDSLKSGVFEIENADARLYVDGVQFTDIQEGDEPVMMATRTANCTGVTVELK